MLPCCQPSGSAVRIAPVSRLITPQHTAFYHFTGYVKHKLVAILNFKVVTTLKDHEALTRLLHFSFTFEMHPPYVLRVIYICFSWGIQTRAANVALKPNEQEDLVLNLIKLEIPRHRIRSQSTDCQLHRHQIQFKIMLTFKVSNPGTQMRTIQIFQTLISS